MDMVNSWNLNYLTGYKTNYFILIKIDTNKTEYSNSYK